MLVQLCVYTSKPHFLAQCIQALHIRCTSLLVQLCVLHQSRTSLLSAYRLFTYAVPPCWYNYAFYIKAALPCSVHTGSPHTLYLLAGTIMRFTSNPHFLAQCIQAIPHTLYLLAETIISLLSAYRLSTYAVPPCWYNYAFYIKAALPCSVHTGSPHTLYLLAGIQSLQLCVLHQSRTSLLSAYRLFTYAVPPCWYNYAFYIKAALPCSVHTGYSHTLYLLAGTIMRFTCPHFLAQYNYAVPPCWYNYAFYQSRTSLLSAYRLFTYAVLYKSKPHSLLSIIIRLPPCWYINIKAALPCSVHTGSSHTLYLLAGTIMRFTSKPHFLAQCIQALHVCCTSLLV